MQIRTLRFQRLLTFVAFVLTLAWSATAQPAPARSSPSQNSSPSLPNAPVPHVALRDLPRNLLHDQASIWTSPARLRSSNILGPAALVLGTTLLITTDHQVMSSQRLNNPSLNSHAVTASNGLIGGFLVAPVVFYGLGRIHHDNHAMETGILSAEAVGDSLAVNEVLKIVSLRERPTVDNARGRFFQTSVGFNSSFPSNHAIIAWSAASVIASEYNGPLTKIAAYGLATGVSVTRVVGREHFPSDVFVGSALGWMIGRYVFHRHAKFF
jgi:membrane-associated phospholipid phosphatase